jgi:hypothetical protein
VWCVCGIWETFCVFTPYAILEAKNMMDSNHNDTRDAVLAVQKPFTRHKKFNFGDVFYWIAFFGGVFLGMYFTSQQNDGFFLLFFGLFVLPIYAVIAIILFVTWVSSRKRKASGESHFLLRCYILCCAGSLITSFGLSEIGKDIGYPGFHHSSVYLAKFYRSEKEFLNRVAAYFQPFETEYQYFVGRDSDKVFFRIPPFLKLNDKTLESQLIGFLIVQNIRAITTDKRGIYFKFSDSGAFDSRTFRGLFFGKPYKIDTPSYSTKFEPIGDGWYIYTIHTG